MWDNFNKKHGSNSVVYSDHHAYSIEIMNRAAFALPPTKSCPLRTCKHECKANYFWEKEKQTKDIHFNELYLNKKNNKLNQILQNGDQFSSCKRHLKYSNNS